MDDDIKEKILKGQDKLKGTNLGAALEGNGSAISKLTKDEAELYAKAIAQQKDSTANELGLTAAQIAAEYLGGIRTSKGGFLNAGTVSKNVDTYKNYHPAKYNGSSSTKSEESK